MKYGYTYLARVIDEPGRIPVNRGVDHRLLVNSEHVTAHSFRFVFFLPFIAKNGTNDLSSILDHHLATL
jgi:hypothetical protein